MNTAFPIVVLAGGEGRRIGGDKAQRRLGGRTLLDHALGAARIWSDQVAVALRTTGGDLLDDPDIAGPLGGLAAALRFARSEGAAWVMTIPCDMPFLPDDLRQRLEAEIGGALAAIASSGGEDHPVCGLWRTGALDRLDDYLATGRRSLRGLAAAVGFVAVDWPVGALDPFFNINDGQDLARAEQILADRARPPRG